MHAIPGFPLRSRPTDRTPRSSATACHDRRQPQRASEIRYERYPDSPYSNGGMEEGEGLAEICSEFPATLAAMRRERGFSQAGLAAAARISRRTVIRWEAGEVSPWIRPSVRGAVRGRLLRACALLAQLPRDGARRDLGSLHGRDLVRNRGAPLHPGSEPVAVQRGPPDDVEVFRSRRNRGS